MLSFIRSNRKKITRLLVARRRVRETYKRRYEAVLARSLRAGYADYSRRWAATVEAYVISAEEVDEVVNSVDNIKLKYKLTLLSELLRKDRVDDGG